MFRQPDFFRHGGIGQVVEILEADLREHRAGFSGVRADVAADKLIGMVKANFGRIHLLKLKFAAAKSELDLTRMCFPGLILTLSLVGMARCAVPVAERQRQAAETNCQNACLATRSALRSAPGGDIAARCPYLSRTVSRCTLQMVAVC